MWVKIDFIYSPSIVEHIYKFTEGTFSKMPSLLENKYI